MDVENCRGIIVAYLPAERLFCFENEAVPGSEVQAFNRPGSNFEDTVGFGHVRAEAPGRQRLALEKCPFTVQEQDIDRHQHKMAVHLVAGKQPEPLLLAEVTAA